MVVQKDSIRSKLGTLGLFIWIPLPFQLTVFKAPNSLKAIQYIGAIRSIPFAFIPSGHQQKIGLCPNLQSLLQSLKIDEGIHRRELAGLQTESTKSGIGNDAGNLEPQGNRLALLWRQRGLRRKEAGLLHTQDDRRTDLCMQLLRQGHPESHFSG